MESTKKNVQETLEVPDKITVSFSNNTFSVKGQKGEVHKKILLPKISCKVEGKTIIFSTERQTRRENKLIFTAKAHLKNLFKGVTEGHVYKLKICSGHFPMNVGVKNNLVEIKNFFGEAVARKVQLPSDVTVKIAAPDITIEGIDLDKTAQAAASIESLTRRPGFDSNRFQDGIYITEKDGKPVI
jgi:large subunit ribosomal protein L6